MKKVLIVLLAVLVALTGGLLVYGATLDVSEPAIHVSKGLLAAPGNDIAEGAAHWYDVESVLNASATNQQKAANLLIYTSYNHINSKGYYCAAHVEVSAGNKNPCSDYYRTVQGGNCFYETYAYTSMTFPPNTAKRRNDYNGQRVEQSSASVGYDKKSKIFSPAWDDPKKPTDRDTSLPGETPYFIYSYFDLPLVFGTRDNAYNEIDASLIGDYVTIEYPNSDAPYYVVEFWADIAKVNASKDTIQRMTDGIGGSKVATILDVYDHTYRIEIWPNGLFRSIEVYARVEAKVGTRKGETKIKRNYEFSYDQVDCSVAKKFIDSGLDKYLNEENKARIRAEYALLPVEEESETPKK